ncbi:MAG: tetratricopeptide repeat protein [Kiritimatiellaeota bacterium]|nr:tetratricopeptide repeat protein [Kiritimatiellota bacterium]
MSTNNTTLFVVCAVVLAAVGCGAPNAEDTFRSGEAAYESGDYATARKHFKRFAKLKPDSDIAAYNLGMACLKLENFSAAADAFERADSLSKDAGTEALEALAQTRRLAGKPDEALKVYDRAIKKANRQPHLLAGMAQCHIDKGQYGYAENSLKEALTISAGKDPAALFNMGVLFTKPAHADPAKAALYYHNFLRHHRNNPEFATETVRAARALAELNDNVPADLREKVTLKIAEAGKFSQDKVKRLNLLFQAWYTFPASQDAMSAYVKQCLTVGGPYAAEAKDMREILELVKQY